MSDDLLSERAEVREQAAREQDKKDRACIVIALLSIVEVLKTKPSEAFERQSLLTTATLAIERIAAQDDKMLETMEVVTDELFKEEDVAFRKTLT